MEDRKAAPTTTGQVIHWAFWYDLLIWAITLGRERAFREKQIEFAHLAPGESVLDVGCGTGSLAILAKERVGPAGRVSGIDASPEMISRARKRAGKAGAEVTFENAVVEALPFPNASFDAVLSTVMMHHLPDDARHQCLSEIRRVLKPGGRLIIVDFGGSEKAKRSWTAHYRKHAHFDIRRVIPELSEVGLRDVESGEVGVRDLWFVRACAPAAA
jgi:ubiquinone/menaquinone biosynthesis C-methylase UbiE